MLLLSGCCPAQSTLCHRAVLGHHSTGAPLEHWDSLDVSHEICNAAADTHPQVSILADLSLMICFPQRYLSYLRAVPSKRENTSNN